MKMILARCTSRFMCILKHTGQRSIQSHLSTSAVVSAGGKWREKQGLDVNRNQFGPLRDLPDWTYPDGSVPPMTLKQKGKREQLKNNVATAVQYSKELDQSKSKLREFKKEQHRKIESSSSRFKRKSSS